MNIAITFRQLEATEAMKAYASEKVAKLQKFLRQPMRARVTMAVEKRGHVCEVEVNAGSGHFLASEKKDDMYASIDGVVDKLERQINGANSSQISRRKGADSARQFAVAQAAAAAMRESQ